MQLKKVNQSQSILSAAYQMRKMHYTRIRNIRQDALHKLTSDLIRRFHTVGLEDLNVQGMLKNRCLARSVVDKMPLFAQKKRDFVDIFCLNE